MKDYFNKDYSFLKDKKLWLFDMDGTIYLGDKLFCGVKEFFSSLKNKGVNYAFITNNSSKGKKDYLSKILGFSIDATEENFYTSVDASIQILKKEFNNSLIYAQGTKSFIKNLIDGGLNVTTDYNENAKCIIVGFDTELNFDKLTTTCKMLLKDIPYYATNPDWVCPTEFGYVPDCGSMCFGIEKATGRKPLFIGKPSGFMIEKAMEKFGVEKKDTVVIGDRIYTDVASGVNAGVDTILVLSGECTIKDYEESEIKPSLVIGEVNKLNKLFK